MKGLLSNAASKAWVGVGLIGAVVVLVVLALQLIPRLGGGQDLVDAASPALQDSQVPGERAGIDFISKYVDVADPLVTARGGGAKEGPELIRLVAKASHLSNPQVRAALRREAPHTEALLRALPLASITREIVRLNAFLAETLSMSETDLQATLDENFPRLAQTLAAIVPVANGWNEIPAPFTRFDGKPVGTVPELRDYFRDDLVGLVEHQADNFQKVDSKGGIGYIPWLLLVIGVGMIVLAVIRARAAAGGSNPGRRAWAAVAAIGVVILLLVLVLSYFPRLSAADRTIKAFKPAFTEQRVTGAREGIALVHDAVQFGDPVATIHGGAAAEVPRLLRFISERTGLSEGQILTRLRGRAPRTTAVLEAIPLSEVGQEVPHLLAFLAKTMKFSGNRLLLTLRKETPGIAQALENVTAVTIGWNEVPKLGDLHRFDGTPVRTMSQLDAYFSEDVIPVLDAQRAHFDKLASTWPPVTYFPPLLVVVGLLIVGYGLFGMRRVARK
ncbi:MAG: hypothetical protein QOG15_1492 [Solirubrobacteraceae bacterium]|jgi:hypothetical protein|nr:hypothetical protein [Solirubrobacteraceae bacterium]